MTDERYQQIWDNPQEQLTPEEIEEGWHFCYEFDALLRNSNEEDFKCNCNEYQNKICPT